MRRSWLLLAVIAAAPCAHATPVVTVIPLYTW